MYVLAIVGTKRKNGLVSGLCKKVLEGAEGNGHQTELLNLYDYRIDYCIGCWACVKAGKCVLQDEFESVFEKIKKADVIVLGSPCYWGNVSGIMKNFFDRHTGFAMYKPPEASRFHAMKWKEKMKTLLSLLRKLGAHPHLRGKKFIIVSAMTVPFPVSHLSGDRKGTVNAMKTYVSKMNGKLIGRIIFTDTLFKFIKNKEGKMIRKAYRIGQRIK